MLRVSPRIDRCEDDETRSHVLDEGQLSAHLRHHELCIEDISEQPLLIRRGKVFDLSPDVGRDFRCHA